MIESVVIEKYSIWVMIIKQSQICYIQVYHGITMSVRTLKRRLQGYNHVKKKIHGVDEDLIRNIIRTSSFIRFYIEYEITFQTLRKKKRNDH